MLHRSSNVDNLIKSGIPTVFNYCLFLSPGGSLGVLMMGKEEGGTTQPGSFLL